MLDRATVGTSCKGKGCFDVMAGNLGNFTIVSSNGGPLKKTYSDWLMNDKLA